MHTMTFGMRHISYKTEKHTHKKAFFFLFLKSSLIKILVGLLRIEKDTMTNSGLTKNPVFFTQYINIILLKHSFMYGFTPYSNSFSERKNMHP